LDKQRLFGDGLAVISGVGFGLVIVGIRWGRPSENRQGMSSSEQIVLYGNFLCFLVTLPMFGYLPRMSEFKFAYGILIAMGIIQLGLGYYLLALGMKRVSAVESS